MVGIAIKFDLGRYHANPWGSHVNEAAAEWPPSPWRIIRALYSTSRTHTALADRRTAIDRALQTLIDAPPPLYSLPDVVAAHTRHYMPKASYSPLRPKDTDKVLDGFLALDREAELRVWWDASLDADAADALDGVARRLGYLGRSESVCSARMVAGAGPESPSAAPAASFDAEGDGWDLIDLLCPRSGRSLEAMAVSVTQLRKSRRLVPDGTEHVIYAVARPKAHAAQAKNNADDRRPTLALFRLRGSARPAVTEAVATGQALRSALQHTYGKRTGGDASATFSGRQGEAPRDDQHRHAHYLSLSDGSGPRIDRLVVWAPEGFRPAEVAALAGVTYITMHGIPERLPTALAALGAIDDLDLGGFVGRSRTWKSLTPFALVRHPKRRRGETIDAPAEQVRRELDHRGFPEPEDVVIEPGQWHRFRSHKAGQSRLQRATVLGVRIRFADEVRGPIALGSFSHYGLGLFGPQT